MAPEILIGEDDDYTDKSDLFSIGVMMYQFYFNSYPFDPHVKNKKKEVLKKIIIQKRKKIAKIKF